MCVSGVGEVKYGRYGKRFLDCICEATGWKAAEGQKEGTSTDMWEDGLYFDDENGF